MTGNLTERRTYHNGKIVSQTDNLSGEQVVYAYDALNRLMSAGATNSSWGQSYDYDGFGNLTNQNVTAGTAPPLSVVYNASTNRQTTDCTDANGNILGGTLSGGSCSGQLYSYDVANRMHPLTGSYYSYAPGNKRVWRGAMDNSGNITLDEVTFWSVTGQRLATYNLSQGANLTTTVLTESSAVSRTYFGGRLIANGTGNVATDRLGSIGKYYPWGQVKPSGNVVGTEGFTGYFRDSETGLDYADQRYHQPGMGRFMTPDPYMASGGAANPGSWNRYAYVGGDPINFKDPHGRIQCSVDPEGDPQCEGEDVCDYAPWLCKGGPGPGGGNGPPPGGADQNCGRSDWSSVQRLDYSVIMGDANTLGLNLNSFTVASMNIVGAAGSTTPGQTELVMTGNGAALTALENSFCQTAGYNSNTPNCFVAAGYDSMHAGTPATQINFRQDTATYSMQITGSLTNGVWTLNIDIDPNNPMAGPPAWLGHAGNVVWNTPTGSDTNYSRVNQVLLKNPKYKQECP